MFSSFFDDRDAGGVGFFIKKSSFPDISSTSCQVVFPGRVIRVTLNFLNGDEFLIWNVHHYAFTSDNYNAFYDAAANEQRPAVNLPQSCLVVMGGDFNLMRDDSLRFNVARPSRVPLPSRSESFSDSDSRLKRFLGSLVEIVQNHTHVFTHLQKLSLQLIDFCVLTILDYATASCEVLCILTPL